MITKGVLLGLDLGSKRIGLAVTSADQKFVFARPALVLKNIQNPKPEIINTIKEISPVGLIAGLPISNNGSYSPQTKIIEKLGQDLSEATNLPIEFVNEYGTSLDAEHRLTEASLMPNRKSGAKDSLAASLILEQYLQGIKNDQTSE